MSTSIRLVGINNLRIRNCASMPGIVYEQGELGLDDLAHSIQIYAEEKPDVLLIPLDSVKGTRQYLIADPDTFLTDIRENPHYWDSVGVGWKSAVEGLQKGLYAEYLSTWWLIIDY